MSGSKSGHKLVTTGLYALVRHPMYLGTLLLGSGFVLIVLSWWGVLVFAFLFYLRFNIQMTKEEQKLEKAFGADFKNYCLRVNRLIPNLKAVDKTLINEFFNLKEALSTKERWGLLAWPLLAVAIENLKNIFLFGSFNVLFNSLAAGVSVLIACLILFSRIFYTAHGNKL